MFNKRDTLIQMFYLIIEKHGNESHIILDIQGGRFGQYNNLISRQSEITDKIDSMKFPVLSDLYQLHTLPKLV